MKKDDVDVRDVVLVLRGGHELFPDWIGAEVLPVLFARRHIVEACHVHKVGHMATGEDACVEDRIEAESLEEWDLTALVKHLYFIGEIFFRWSFVAAELVNSFGAWSL